MFVSSNSSSKETFYCLGYWLMFDKIKLTQAGAVLAKAVENLTKVFWSLIAVTNDNIITL